jgi:hypothetical protein
MTINVFDALHLYRLYILSLFLSDYWSPQNGVGYQYGSTKGFQNIQINHRAYVQQYRPMYSTLLNPFALKKTLLEHDIIDFEAWLHMSLYLRQDQIKTHQVWMGKDQLQSWSSCWRCTPDGRRQQGQTRKTKRTLRVMRMMMTSSTLETSFLPSWTP